MADKAKQAFQDLLVKLDELDRTTLNEIPQLVQLSEKTGQKKVHILLAGAVLMLAVILFGFGQAAVVMLVGFGYPAYASFKALKSSGKDDDTQWLTYWVVFSFFNVVESFTDIFIFWIPFYHLLKVAFLVWCFLPQTQGAQFIFVRFIYPFLTKYESRIDAQLEKIQKTGKNILDTAKDKAVEAVTEAVKEEVKKSATDKKDE